MTSAHYVYAIVGRHTPLPDAAESGAALALVPCRELAAVTRRMQGDGGALTMEAMLRHEAIVEAVREQGPALPVRFGTVFRDATSVATAIADQYQPLAADLARLGDKEELSVTALWSAPPPVAEPPAHAEAGADADADAETEAQSAGARYLRARADELRRDEALKDSAQRVARELDDVLAMSALDRRVSLLPTPRVAVRLAYLMDPAGVPAFREAFDAMRPHNVRLLLTGPWPPYSFVRRPG